MFSKVLLRLCAPLLLACPVFSFLNAQTVWERDPGFAGGDTIHLGNGRAEEAIAGMAQLPDGKILAAGRLNNSLSYILARYEANGQPDPAFGVNGTTVFPITGFTGGAKDILTLPGGQFILGASSDDAQGAQVFTLIRFLPDGRPDSTFGANGLAFGAASPGLADKLNAILRQPDGKILAAGSSFADGAPSDQQSVMLSRFLANGKKDNTFGANGTVRLPYPGQNFEFHALALQPDGRIVAAGSNDDLILVARFQPNGQPDSTFGLHGVRQLQYSAAGKTRCRAVSVLPGGKILLGGWCHEYWLNNGAVLVRLQPDGASDPTFGNSGIIGMSFVHCDYQLSTSAMVVQGDGRIVLATNGQNNDPKGVSGIFRFLPDGTVDSSFAVNGEWLQAVGSGNSALCAVFLTTDGKILAGGTAKERDDYDFMLLRLYAHGDYDPLFGNNGRVFTNFGWGRDWIHSLHRGPGGSVLATGNAFNSNLMSAGSSCVLTKLLANGSPDLDFGYAGTLLFPAGETEAVTVQPDGKILVGTDNYAGTTGYPLQVFRFLANGMVDSTFGQIGHVDSVLGTFLFASLAHIGVLSTGKIIVAGTGIKQPGASRDLILTCLNPDGSRDSTFGNKGLVLRDFNSQNDAVDGLLILPGDKILLVGNCWNGSVKKRDVVLMRLHYNGAPDALWGQDGVLFDDFEAPAGEQVTSMTLTPDGKLMLAVLGQLTLPGGQSAQAKNVLARYNANGSPDAAFGSNGKVQIPLDTPWAVSRYIRQIRFLPGGKFLTAAFLPAPAEPSDSVYLAVQRYFPNGDPDTSPGGYSLLSDGFGYPRTSTAFEMAEDGSQAWIGASTFFDFGLNEDIALARYRSVSTTQCLPLSVQSLTGDHLDGTTVSILPTDQSASCPEATILTGCEDATICLCGQDSLIIVPYRNDNPLNGVSTFDLVLISKHILGSEPLSTPYKRMAADVNRSGSVTTFDILEIRKLILGIYQNFPNNTSWRFVRKDFQFSNPNNPFAKPVPERDTIVVFNPPAQSGFWAVKVGDVNDSHLSGCDNLSEAEPRQSATLRAAVCPAAPGEEVTVPVAFSADAVGAGWQGALRFDPAALELVRVIPAQDLEAGNFGLSDAGRGLIRVLWYAADGEDRPVRAGETLFRLVFRVKKALREPTDLLAGDEAVLPGRLYRSNGEAARLGVSVTVGNCPVSGSALRVLPNPVGDALCLQAENAGVTAGELVVYNAAGAVCLQRELHGEPCFGEVSGWPAGLYVWRFSDGRGGTLGGKFLKQ